MRNYEAIIIINPEVSDQLVQEELNKIEATLKKEKATNVVFDRWGKKEIAYKVAKTKVGNFICIKFEGHTPNLINELLHILSINDKVIKYQICRTGEKTKKFKYNPRIKYSEEDIGVSVEDEIEMF